VPRDGVVRILRDKKGRGGKTVSLITGVPGSSTALAQLTSELKRQCGTGGTLRGDVIEIQGDFRERLKAELAKRGYTVKLPGGTAQLSTQAVQRCVMAVAPGPVGGAAARVYARIVSAASSACPCAAHE